MMEELKQLVELILKLPNTALWILAGFLLYKLSIVGSIYGVIRFAIEKAHNLYHTKIIEGKKPVITLYKWKDGVEPISEEVKTSIVNSLIKLKVHTDISKYSSTYVHSSYSQVLDDLVNDYISRLPAKK